MIEIAKLEKTFAAETAADKWWDGLNKKEKQAYIKAHPRSKYAKKAYVPSKITKKQYAAIENATIPKFGPIVRTPLKVLSCEITSLN